MKSLLSLLGLFAWAIAVLADEATFTNLTMQYKSQVRGQLAGHTAGCTGYAVGVRREWGALSRRQRAAYISAVKCLQTKPSKAPADFIPGSRSRFDDFMGVHINQTFDVHFNARLLPWHRYFLWKYEKALREECGYRGYQPYWEWAKYKDDPESSPLFDGSDYSLSGNGESIPHDDISFVLPRTNITVQIPAGPGGGCIHNGPFKDMKVNLGPTSFSGFLGPAVGSGTGLDYNPRCLKRDINPLFSRERMSYQVITDLLTKTANYDDLVTNIGREGVHPSGHQTVGGLMVDQFASAGDPVFYLHHAGVDRMWAIWQSLKPSERQNQLQGFTTWFNIPPSPEIKPEDPIDLWFEAGPKAAVDLTNTVENDFCYYYD